MQIFISVELCCIRLEYSCLVTFWHFRLASVWDFLKPYFGGRGLIIPFSLRYGRDAKVVHFLGKLKPWDYSYDTTSKTLKGHSQDASDMLPNYLLQWWEIFSSSVLALMKEEYGDQPFHSGCTEVSNGFTRSALLPRVAQ